MTRASCLLALTLTVATAAPAAAFTTLNHYFAKETGPGQFAVAWRGGLSGPSDFWCAAGDFVIRGMGLPASTRIWRVSPEPRRGGEPMLFSLSPEGSEDTGLMILFGEGNSVSAMGTRAFCEH
jgi:hypothetical protein